MREARRRLFEALDWRSLAFAWLMVLVATAVRAYAEPPSYIDALVFSGMGTTVAFAVLGPVLVKSRPRSEENQRKRPQDR